MKRNSAKGDIQAEGDVGAAYIIELLENHSGIKCTKVAQGRHPEYDTEWEDNSTKEHKNDYLRALTGNFALEEKCVLASTATTWQYGMCRFNISEAEQKEITDDFWRVKRIAKNGFVDETREKALELFQRLKDIKANLEFDVYEWTLDEIKVLSKKEYLKVRAGDDGRAWCFVIPVKDVSDNKIFTVQDVKKDFVKLFYENMSNEMKKIIRYAEKKSND